MRDKKQNVFNDFIAVAEYLKKIGAKVVILGRSNGGLLVGAVLTQRPDVIDGAVIGYPVLDMLRFHKLFIGEAWVSEYGDPENPEDVAFLVKYSPYHNIKEGINYPPTLVFTGLHDDRVHPGHAYKFVAKLKHVGANILLRVEQSSGHAGATTETKAREYSEIMAFVYKVLDMDP
jgi:prolyl oligopeptidase